MKYYIQDKLLKSRYLDLDKMKFDKWPVDDRMTIAFKVQTYPRTSSTARAAGDSTSVVMKAASALRLPMGKDVIRLGPRYPTKSIRADSAIAIDVGSVRM